MRKVTERVWGHQELHISPASAKCFLPDGTRWDVKLLLITMLLASIALVLLSNHLISMELRVLITSNWNATQIILLSFFSPTSKSSCHPAPIRALPLGRSRHGSLPTYSHWLFRTTLPWEPGCYRHFSRYIKSVARCLCTDEDFKSRR